MSLGIERSPRKGQACLEKDLLDKHGAMKYHAAGSYDVLIARTKELNFGMPSFTSKNRKFVALTRHHVKITNPISLSEEPP
jgi:hypothetical protein